MSMSWEAASAAPSGKGWGGWSGSNEKGKASSAASSGKGWGGWSGSNEGGKASSSAPSAKGWGDWSGCNGGGKASYGASSGKGWGDWSGCNGGGKAASGATSGKGWAGGGEAAWVSGGGGKTSLGSETWDDSTWEEAAPEDSTVDDSAWDADSLVRSTRNAIAGKGEQTTPPMTPMGGKAGTEKAAHWNGKGVAKGPGALAGKAAAKGDGAEKTDWAFIVSKASDDCELMDKTIKELVEASQKIIQDENSTLPQVKLSLDSFTKHDAKLKELQSHVQASVRELNKSGGSVATHKLEMAKLPGKLVPVQFSITKQVNLLKQKHEKLKGAAELKAKEAKDTVAFRFILQKLNKDVVIAEAAVQNITRSAKPLLDNPPEASEALDRKVEAIQNSAEDAFQKLESARKEVFEKSQEIKQYAPEAKKAAQVEFAALHKKVAEHFKLCGLYKNFKKELLRVVEAKKVIAEVTEKVNDIEAELGKADEIMKASESVGFVPAQIEELAAIFDPAHKALVAVLGTIDEQTKGADASTQSSLEQLKTKTTGLQNRVAELNLKMKPEKDKKDAQEAITMAAELMKKCEANLKACQDAEMPFLIGVEILDNELSGDAIKECEDAAKVAIADVTKTMTHLKSKITACKSMEKEVGEPALVDLEQCLARAQVIQGKLTAFRKETQDRKQQAILADAYAAATKAEEKMKEVETASKLLLSNELEESSVEEIKAGLENSKPMVQEGTTVLAETKKLSFEKQKMAKASQNDIPMKTLNARLQAVSENLTKVKNAQNVAEKLIKAKEVIEVEGPNMAKAEEEAAKAEKAMPAQDAAMTEEAVQTIEKACAVASKLAKAVGSAVQSLVQSAPKKTKIALNQLLDRKTAVLAKVSNITTSTNRKRDELFAEKYIKTVTEKVDAAQALNEAMEETEAPFLLGGSLTLKEMQDHLAKCDAAIASSQKAIEEVRTLTAKKTYEAKSLDPMCSRKVREAFAEQSKKVDAFARKVAAFVKVTQERRHTANVMEASEIAGALEADVKLVLEKAAPFTKEGADTMSEEDAAGPLKEYSEVANEVKSKIAKVKGSLSSLLRESRGNADQVEKLKTAEGQLSAAGKELAKAGDATKLHEQRALATRLIAQSKEAVGTLDAEVKKAADACAPLLVHGGDQYLVAASVSTLTSALLDRMNSKSYTQEDLFKDMGKGKCPTETVFVEYIAIMGETDHEELSTFKEERRKAIFQKVSADGKAFKSDDLKKLLRRTYMCSKAVSVTSEFEAAGSEAVCKVEPGTEVTLTSPEKEDEAGMSRCQCTVNDKTGWITIKQAKGATYLQPVQAFKMFCDSVTRATTDSTAAIKKVGAALGAATNQCVGKEGPLTDAKKEIVKLQDQVAAALGSIDKVKKDFVVAKREYTVKEIAELNAHIEAKNKKEAAKFVGPVVDKVVATETAAKTAEEAAAPMSSLSGDALKAFATPATVLEAVEKAAAEATTKATEFKDAIEEQFVKIGEVKPATGGTAEAKKQFAALQQRVEAAAKSCTRALDNIRAKCQFLAKSQKEATADAIRKSMQANGLTPEQQFTKLAETNDKIAEASFCSFLTRLEGLALTDEQAKLLCRVLEKEGISKNTFLNLVSVYYKVLKSIAYTDQQEVFSVACKMLQKAEKDELIELYEGPVTMKDAEMVRIRGRSLATGIEGWITLSGSKGTTFLEQVKKPYYKVKKETSIAQELGGNSLRALEVDEILELLEGPKEMTPPDIERSRVRTEKDKKLGWITTVDESGKHFVKSSDHLIIKKGILMTTEKDIVSKDTKVIRRLDEGEEFQMLGELVTDVQSGVTRCQGKALKDGKEGWITTTGNHGTVYADSKGKTCVVLAAVALQKDFGAESMILRKLEVGEYLSVIEGPRKFKSPVVQCVRVKAAKDGQAGWVALKDSKGQLLANH